jgi:CRISPR-associated protein Cas1
MIKRTLYFGNPAYISLSNHQLSIQKGGLLKGDEVLASIPIEDVGVVVADHPQITLTQHAVIALQENNAVILWCGSNHMPVSMSLPLAMNDTFTAKVRYQIQASEPLKKQLWKQTVSAKILNQSSVLSSFGHPYVALKKLAARVTSGDAENREGQAAAIYWQHLLTDYDVNRGRYDGGPNAMLNYGYAILRAVIARSLVGSGCLTVMGIHHSNQYNAHCLADDIMEPYRPVIDKLVLEYIKERGTAPEELTKEVKAYLLQIPAVDVIIQGKASPLMVGAQRTTASLVKCFQGTARKILYPEL